MKIVWFTIKKILADYVKSNKFIARCYIRNGAASGPQNPFLSDFDLTFFLKADNLKALIGGQAKISKKINSHLILRRLCSDFLVLPDTSNAYNLCDQYYLFRSVYPMEDWLPVEQSQPSKKSEIKHTLPLDCFPEKTLSYYITNVLMGRMRPVMLQPFLLKRCLKKDYIAVGFQPPRSGPYLLLYEALLREVDLWSQFYKGINVVDSQKGHIAVIRPLEGYDPSPYSTAWNNIRTSSHLLKAVSSVWFYPRYQAVMAPNLIVNLKPGISADMCKRAFREIFKAMHGLKFTLAIGREESTIARINSLSWTCLLDPWLLKYYGCGLFGSFEVKDKIIEPAREMLTHKFHEILLRFFSEIMYTINCYNYYKTCFIFDRFLTHNEIILDETVLSRVYHSEFVLRENFDRQRDMQRLLSFLEDKYGVSLF